MIDYEKWERLQRQEKALANEAEYLKTKEPARRLEEMEQYLLFKKAVESQGLRARRGIVELLNEYTRDPKTVIAALKAEDHPAVIAAEEHQMRLSALRRAEAALADVERRLAAFRPSYFRMRDFVATVGAYQ